MTPALLESCLDHARRESPLESCGIITTGPDDCGIYHPCRNIGGDDEFSIHPEDWAAAEDKGIPLAIVHSHPGGPLKPSPCDLQNQHVSRLPWIIVDPESGQWKRFGDVPFTGRPFAWGVSDCYSLAYDALGLDADFLRYPKFWNDSNLFLDNLKTAGFAVVDIDPEPGDGLLFAIYSETVNHCAIYQGDGMILHHLPGRLSTSQPMGAWVKRLRHVLRRSA